MSTNEGSKRSEEMMVKQQAIDYVSSLTPEQLQILIDNHDEILAEWNNLFQPQPPMCPCFPRWDRHLLWEEEMRRTRNSNKVTGWLTLYHVADIEHTGTGHGNPKLAVWYTDVTIPRAERQPYSWIHDITPTPLGEWMIKAWTSLNPEEYAALPKTHEEWLDGERRSAMEGLINEVKASGIDEAGLSYEQIVAEYHKLWEKRERESLERRECVTRGDRQQTQ